MTDMDAHKCWACGGSGGEMFLHAGYAVWETCDDCSGSGFIRWEPEPGLPDEYDDGTCEAIGHAPGCPHDPTDYDVGGWD